MSSGKTQVTFSIICETDPTERVVLAGDDPLLGSWDPLRGIVLSLEDKEESKWQVKLKLPTGTRFEYRYFLVSREEQEEGFLNWGMQNSSLTFTQKRPESIDGSRELLTEGEAMDVDDGYFDALPEEGVERIMVTNAVDEKAQKVVVIALYRLPIISKRDDDGNWSFKWDDDALYLTSVGFREGMTGRQLRWVGILNSELTVPVEEQQAVRKTLLEEFDCYPLFIPKSVLNQFYQGFCKGVLWPVFHTVARVTDDFGKTITFDENLWRVYCEVNKIFSEGVISLYKAGNMIWIHDYHLMVLPAYLRMKLSGAHIGFFLHVPWPSSEAYRMLPMREQILLGLLSSSLIGFNLFDYARHFLSACVRLLNIEHESSAGSLGVQYGGRHVMIRVSQIGIHPARFRNAILEPAVAKLVKDSAEKHKGLFVLGAIDDLDFIKGISLKLLAYESLMVNYCAYRGKVTLIQVAIPKTARVKESLRREIRGHVDRINKRFGTPGYQPVEYIERDISFYERVALYRITDALFLTPLRDGLNLIPYEYLISTEDEARGQVILSEFIGCSRALSSAVRLNPWSFDEVTRSIDMVMQRDRNEATERHKADVNYVLTHTTATWGDSFLKDLEKASEPVHEVTCLGLGLGLGKRLVAFAGFSLLNAADVVKAYRRSTNHVFFLDYDGTLTNSTCSSRMAHAWARPSDSVRAILQKLSTEAMNTVVIMSGRTRDTLQKSFGDMYALGIAAEHGYFYRQPYHSEWETQQTEQKLDSEWLKTVYDIMSAYTQRTDGSYIEEKTAGLVWHYLDADPEFGTWQAKEMAAHLESVLDITTVEVISGVGWVQVRYQHISKGTMVQRVLKDPRFVQEPDFILCVGDDQTDEDMFSYLEENLSPKKTTVFTCTVGIQPSRARFYVRHSEDVVALLSMFLTSDLRPSVSNPESVGFRQARS